MFRSLTTKIAAILLGVFFAVGLLFMLVARLSMERYMLEVTQTLNEPVAEYVVSNLLPLKDRPYDSDTLRSLFGSLMLINPSAELYVVDAEGAVVAYSAPPEKIKRRVIALEPVRRYLSGESEYPVLGDDPRHPGRQKIFSAAPLSVDAESDGYLYVIFGGEEFDSLVDALRGSYVFELSLWALVVVLAFALMTGLLVFVVLTRRLARLASTMEAFEVSGFSNAAQVDTLWRRQGGDEIDRLGATFTHMAKRIVQQIGSLREADSMRRRLVANVSHDLRTPLATLTGYLETLLMKIGQLTAEAQRQHVVSALKSTQRLVTLAGDLFELAKLDFRESEIPMETFSLGELVQDVTQELKLRAEERRIDLVVDFSHDLPAVTANIGMIERVLVNLLDNAVRHAAHSGVVRVALRPSANGVRIDVRDDGEGIPESDLRHVFEPFYRADTAERAGRAGSGLGLAIVHRLLELHEVVVSVENLTHGGVSFSFELPVRKC